MVPVMGMVMGRMIRTETGIVIRMGVIRGAWTRIRMGAVRGLVRGAGTGVLRRTGSRARVKALRMAGMGARMGAGIVVLRGALTRAWRMTWTMMGGVGGECQDS